MTAKCPVCWRPLFFPGDIVHRHRDKAGNNCPMSGQPFHLIQQAESDVA